MPRKLRQLKADLRKAGFIEESDRGKGSHGRWIHPEVTGSSVHLSGHDGDDARHYQERNVREAIAKVEAAGPSQE
jgi:predicted RNA binding protein YcfA (HicA-like mRNA interferase family)